MAIIIEEEKNRSNLVRILGWAIITIVIFGAIYYVFFAAPQLVVIVPSGNLGAIEPIVQGNLNASQVLTSPAFKALQPGTIPPVSTSTDSAGGRPNPFVSP